MSLSAPLSRRRRATSGSPSPEALNRCVTPLCFVWSLSVPLSRRRRATSGSSCPEALNTCFAESCCRRCARPWADGASAPRRLGMGVGVVWGSGDPSNARSQMAGLDQNGYGANIQMEY